LVAIGLGNKYGYMNQNGEVVIPLTYDFADTFSEGLAYVRKGGKNVYINSKEEVVLDLDYDYLYTFFDGLAKVQKNEKFGYINKKGIQITPIKYDRAAPFVDGYSKVELNGLFGYINKEGKEVIPVVYNKLYDIDNGYVRAVLNDKWGLLDINGEIQSCPGLGKLCNLEYMGGFVDGLALVGIKDKNDRVKYGYIDTNLNLVIPMVLDYAEDFTGKGYAKVVYESKECYINTEGKFGEMK